MIGIQNATFSDFLSKTWTKRQVSEECSTRLTRAEGSASSSAPLSSVSEHFHSTAVTYAFILRLRCSEISTCGNVLVRSCLTSRRIMLIYLQLLLE